MTKKVVVKIEELKRKNGLSLRKLADRVGIRHATLSELSNGKRESISFSHIERIANELGINDIRDIIDFVDEDATK